MGWMEIPEEHKALAARLGEEEYEARMRMEQRLRERRGEGQGKRLFRFEHRFDTYGLIRFCLNVSGFWKRAERNYFDIQAERNEVFIADLPKEFDGYTILQLTDLHADLHPEFPLAVKQAIAPLEYDCVALTGDFRTCTFGDHTGATEATIEIVSEVQKPIYAILGNHDSLAKVPAMESTGIRFLLNEHTVIQRGEAQICLIGIDDPNFYRTHCFERAMRGVRSDGTKILLSHSPQTYRVAAEAGIDFLIAGHTHGGQICLPGGYILMHDGSSPRHVLSGRWVEGKLQGYTSRGTGASGVTARLNCPSEVTLHTLRCG